MDDKAELLKQLKDLHYPEPISDFPIAIGWWLLLVVVIATVGLVVRFLLLSFKRNEYRRNAISKIDAIFSEVDDKALLFNINALLKSIAIKQYPSLNCASLNGRDWVLFLRNSLPNINSLDGDSFISLEDIYSHSVELTNEPREELKKDVLYWLKKHLSEKKIAEKLKVQGAQKNV